MPGFARTASSIHQLYWFASTAIPVPWALSSTKATEF
jgi:Putative transcriptional regulator